MNKLIGTYDQHIGIYENILTKEQCEEFINHFEFNKDAESHIRFEPDYNNEGKLELVPSTSKMDETVFIRLSNTDLPQKSIYKLLDILFNRLLDSYKEYVTIYPGFNSDADLTPIIRLQKTVPGGGYHVWHYENEMEHYNRHVVWTLYLNNVDEGGETEFLHQHKRIPAKQGTLVIFPAGPTHMHRGNQPLDSEKYILTGWLIRTDIPYDRSLWEISSSHGVKKYEQESF